MNRQLLQFINDNFTAPASALDLGCGRGEDVRYLQKLGWQVMGVDLPEVDLNEEFKADREFDLVYSIAVLQFIKNRQTFVDTCYNNLKADGKLFILTFDKADTSFKTELSTPEELELLLSSKFKNIEITKETIEDNHKPIGPHQHVLLVATAVKK